MNIMTSEKWLKQPIEVCWFAKASVNELEKFIALWCYGWAQWRCSTDKGIMTLKWVLQHCNFKELLAF